MTKICPKCGMSVPANAKFCLSCGTKLKDTCLNCGAELFDNANFCGMCGHRLNEKEEPAHPAAVPDSPVKGISCHDPEDEDDDNEDTESSSVCGWKEDTNVARFYGWLIADYDDEINEGVNSVFLDCVSTEKINAEGSDEYGVRLCKYLENNNETRAEYDYENNRLNIQIDVGNNNRTYSGEHILDNFKETILNSQLLKCFDNKEVYIIDKDAYVGCYIDKNADLDKIKQTMYNDFDKENRFPEPVLYEEDIEDVRNQENAVLKVTTHYSVKKYN